LGQRGSSGSALLPRVLICLPAYFEWPSSLLKLFFAQTLLRIFLKLFFSLRGSSSGEV
jgi:hypothetical protein